MRRLSPKIAGGGHHFPTPGGWSGSLDPVPRRQPTADFRAARHSLLAPAPRLLRQRARRARRRRCPQRQRIVRADKSSTPSIETFVSRRASPAPCPRRVSRGRSTRCVFSGRARFRGAPRFERTREFRVRGARAGETPSARRLSCHRRRRPQHPLDTPARRARRRSRAGRRRARHVVLVATSSREPAAPTRGRVKPGCAGSPPAASCHRIWGQRPRGSARFEARLPSTRDRGLVAVKSAGLNENRGQERGGSRRRSIERPNVVLSRVRDRRRAVSFSRGSWRGAIRGPPLRAFPAGDGPPPPPPPPPPAPPTPPPPALPRRRAEVPRRGTPR